jgi:hypothetical protein
LTLLPESYRNSPSSKIAHSTSAGVAGSAISRPDGTARR